MASCHALLSDEHGIVLGAPESNLTRFGFLRHASQDLAFHDGACSLGHWYSSRAELVLVFGIWSLTFFLRAAPM